MRWPPGQPLPCCRAGSASARTGTSKGHQGDPDYEVMRFIMKVVPLNSVSLSIDGFVEQLPYMGQWSNLLLESWEPFVWSSEDIACMFYVISIPEVWRSYMCFNWRESPRALAARVLGRDRFAPSEKRSRRSIPKFGT